MTDKETKRYEEECKNSGNLDYPLAGRISTPLCKICKNAIYKPRLWPPRCSVFGMIPDTLGLAKSYECDSFVHDSSSGFNQFFDKNHKPL